jgi:hypothetical protein
MFLRQILKADLHFGEARCLLLEDVRGKVGVILAINLANQNIFAVNLANIISGGDRIKNDSLRQIKTELFNWHSTELVFPKFFGTRI